MKIKFSKRGLTFSFKANETFKAGTKYRYIVDNKNSEVILLPDENGKYKLSKKGSQEKPLVDLRNEEIREAMSMARYMEVEVMDDKIIVHIIKTSVSFDTLSDVEISNIIKKSDEVTFTIDKEQLKSHNTALSDMLTSAGLFSARVRDDMSYVFDVGSLYSGAGGFDYAFAKDEAFDMKYAVDNDKWALETYKANVGDHVICKDMRKLSEDEVPSTDLIISGVCCQPFSQENRTEDTESSKERRRLLVDDFNRITKAKAPLMFVVENVPQFITKDKGKYIERILTELSDYNVTYSVVNDLDVGGYSTRQRMILIGSCKEIGTVAIPNVELASHRTAGGALRKVTSDWFNYNDVTKSRKDTEECMSYVRPGHNFRDIPEAVKHFGPSTHADRYQRLSMDEPAPTITNWRKPIIMPPEGNRILSVAEAAAIMGLDKNFKFYGPLDRKQQQVGNMVTQAIAHFVKSIVKNALYRYANESLGLQVAA